MRRSTLTALILDLELLLSSAWARLRGSGTSLRAPRRRLGSVS
ncbi:MAG: hypothetical protein AAF725_13670 [Acidobacteriota bacterium]